MRPRLVLVAPDMVTVVRHAGGWVFDQVMAGWDVAVLAADQTDARPLQILGARMLRLDSGLAAPAPGAWPHGLAVESGLYARLASVRQMVDEAIAGGISTVWFWGAEGAPDPGRDAGCHRLSVAARAFKAQALAAAAEPIDVIGMTELFRTGMPPLTPDKVSA